MVLSVEKPPQDHAKTFVILRFQDGRSVKMRTWGTKGRWVSHLTPRISGHLFGAAFIVFWGKGHLQACYSDYRCGQYILKKNIYKKEAVLPSIWLHDLHLRQSWVKWSECTDIKLSPTRRNVLSNQSSHLKASSTFNMDSALVITLVIPGQKVLSMSNVRMRIFEGWLPGMKTYAPYKKE